MLRCLIVDDSPRFLDAARGLLERQGITVVGVASNSAEALQRAQELRPDVTLLDIDLGRESGLEVARRLHGQPGGRVPGQDRPVGRGHPRPAGRPQRRRPRRPGTVTMLTVRS